MWHRKARLCVRGFEEDIYPRSDSHTANGEAMKLFLAISANNSFNLKSLDVTSAFLQGETLEREYMLFHPLKLGNLARYGSYKKMHMGFMMHHKNSF